MLSRGAMGSLHDGQCDAGRMIASFRGTRQMTTLRNEPMTRPYTPLIAATSAVIEPRLERTSATSADVARRGRRSYHFGFHAGSPGSGALPAAHPPAPP